MQVLGTKFNFRAYPDVHEVLVSLLEGKVELSNLLKKEKEAFLAPDERAILNKANGLMTVETVTASNASQWTDGYLFFDEELLPDIVKELERSYNVNIHIANDSLNKFRFYGNFVRREQSIQEVLDALASTAVSYTHLDVYKRQNQYLVVVNRDFRNVMNLSIDVDLSLIHI